MAKNLLKAGQELMVSDLNQAALDEVAAAGAKVGSYREIGAGCDVIITILPTGSIVQEVLFGKDGVASGLTAGKVVCDMSSVTPGRAKPAMPGSRKWA